MSEAYVISTAMQDYLETILELSEKKGLVRVTDIAAKLGIAKASVNQAIHSLKGLKLARHERYGPIELTSKGREHAVKIRRRHQLLRKFLIEVLDVDPKTAEKDACLMEHVISPVTLERLIEFLETMSSSKEMLTNGEVEASKKAEKIATEKGILKMGAINKTNVPDVRALSELKPGTRGKVIRIVGTREVRRRILDMGVVPGAKIVIEGVAPLGDPIEVMVKGYHLSLRKNEAADIFVELL
ncbi:MAG: DtxR family transcriptional regulator [Firmicutes bacterium]|nr:DtxR family transcriptional regulator [Bacillota bacterium]